MDSNWGTQFLARTARPAGACRVAAVAALACLFVLPSSLAARPPRVAATEVVGPVSRIPAGPPRLWRDSRGQWLHANARALRIFVGAHTPRIRFWITRAAQQYSQRTLLKMQIVEDLSQANVVIREGHYGRDAVIAWTQLCAGCAMAYVTFNLDQLARLGNTPTAIRDVRGIACHELGHVAGLGHGGGDCMSFTYARTYTLGVGAANARLLDWAYRRAYG